MGLQEDFARALKETEIHRHRHSRLLTAGFTELPYVLLCPSLVNEGDTVVRQGMVQVSKPQIVLMHNPEPMDFEGFEYQNKRNESGAFLALGRMASFPPGRYSNIETRLDVFDGTLERAVSHYNERLDRAEDDATGLVTGPVDFWALSLFIYVGQVVAQSAPNDIQEWLRRHFPRHGL